MLVHALQQPSAQRFFVSCCCALLCAHRPPSALDQWRLQNQPHQQQQPTPQQPLGGQGRRLPYNLLSPAQPLTQPKQPRRSGVTASRGGKRRRVDPAGVSEHIARARQARYQLRAELEAARAQSSDDEQAFARKERRRMAKDLARLAPVLLAPAAAVAAAGAARAAWVPAPPQQPAALQGPGSLGSGEGAQQLPPQLPLQAQQQQQQPVQWVPPADGFESIGGLEEVKRSLREMVLLPLSQPDLLRQMGITAPRYACNMSAHQYAMAGFSFKRPLACGSLRAAPCVHTYCCSRQHGCFHSLNPIFSIPDPHGASHPPWSTLCNPCPVRSNLLPNSQGHPSSRGPRHRQNRPGPRACRGVRAPLAAPCRAVRPQGC